MHTQNHSPCSKCETLAWYFHVCCKRVLFANYSWKNVVSSLKVWCNFVELCDLYSHNWWLDLLNYVRLYIYPCGGQIFLGSLHLFQWTWLLFCIRIRTDLIMVTVEKRILLFLRHYELGKKKWFQTKHVCYHYSREFCNLIYNQASVHSEPQLYRIFVN